MRDSISGTFISVNTYTQLIFQKSIALIKRTEPSKKIATKVRSITSQQNQFNPTKSNQIETWQGKKKKSVITKFQR